ncbi:MAG: hypothetical protein EAX96_01570 [Candidatus Lokiarchaeota archaeon]|nr:hypothetical protein [Candidatus Lokiarchaeota archaeon]
MLNLLDLEYIDKNNVTITNEFIKINFLKENNEVKIHFFYKNKNKWVLIASNFQKNDEKKHNNRLLEIAHGIVSNDLQLNIYNIIKDKEKIKVILKGHNEFYQLIIQITLIENDKFIHIKNILSIFNEISLEYLMNSFNFRLKGINKKNPKFVWIPNLRPYKNCVIGDHVFRSPAIILYQDGMSMSLIPDLEILYGNRKMQTCMNYLKSNDSNEFPYLSFGFMKYGIKGHIYYEHTNRMKKKFKRTQLLFGYHLHFDNSENFNECLRTINSFLWNRYAKKILDSTVRPQVLSLDKYGKYAYDAIFTNFNGIWREIEINSKICGGYYYLTWSGGKKNPKPKFKKDIIVLEKATKPSLIYRIFQNYLASSLNFLKISEIYLRIIGGLPAPQYIYNQSWFSNIRSAIGMMYFAQQWNDKNLEENAKKMKNLALNSPENQGLFHSVLALYEEHNELKHKWIPGTVAILPTNHFHIPDCSWTAFWLLKWYEIYGEDDKILKKCKDLGELLIQIQQDNGSIPAWVKIQDEKFEINEILKNSASTACPMLFLTILYKYTKDKKYLDASKKAAKFIDNEVIPEDKWFDFETYFSCSRKNFDEIDEFTGIYPQNNLSIQWAAEAFKELYKLTQNNLYLKLGLHCIELLCLYQQIWDAPYISINTFGGFGVMNTDAEWNDARQAQFALTFMEYYEITGVKEFFERGIAALRSSFTLMLINENKNVAPGNLKRFNEFDTGASFENYGHCGRDRKILGYIQFDWGSASASCSSALALMQFGDIYIDMQYQNVFGINGILIKEFNIGESKIELTLKLEVKFDRKIIIKVHEPKNEKYNIIINKNKAGIKSKKELKNGILIDPQVLEYQ